MTSVCLSVLGVEYSLTKLLMRWMSNEKVTHFTAPLLQPWVSSESDSQSFKEREISD